MTNEQMKTALAQEGVSTEVIERFTSRVDVEKISDIVDAAANPREAFENIKSVYPELDVDEAMKQMDFVQSQIEAAANTEENSVPLELTEDELDKVSGGGWFDIDWKKLAKAVGVGLLGAVGGAILGAGAGCIFAAAGAVLGLAAVGAVAGGVCAGMWYWNRQTEAENKGK